jgi:hypothetical protein
MVMRKNKINVDYYHTFNTFFWSDYKQKDKWHVSVQQKKSCFFIKNIWIALEDSTTTD